MPGDQVYDAPPLAVNVVLPLQTMFELDDTVIIGLTGPYITVTVLDDEQPLLFVPITVYVVVTDGETASVELVVPVLQLYVVAPAADSVLDDRQTIVGEAATDKVGNGLTVIDIVLVLTHPFELVALTVYNVVTVGDTIITEPVAALGFHV